MEVHRILITGATGFIGRELVKRIIDDCYDCSVLLPCRNIEKAKILFERTSSIQICALDSRDKIRSFRPEIIVHLAADNNTSDNLVAVKALIDSNITLGVELLNIVAPLGSLKFFVNTGSFSQYFNGRDGGSIRAKSGDAYLYSATKSAFEVFLKYFSGRFVFDYITAVPFSVYGGKSDVKRVIDYIRDSITSPVPVDMSPGNQVLDFIHVEDVIDFYMAALKAYIEGKPLDSGCCFFVGTGKGTTIKELCGVIEGVSGKQCKINWGGRDYRENDILYAVAELDKNPKSITWSPRVSLREGLKDYLKDNYVG